MSMPTLMEGSKVVEKGFVFDVNISQVDTTSWITGKLIKQFGAGLGQCQ